jgi:hypothetical protein
METKEKCVERIEYTLIYDKYIYRKNLLTGKLEYVGIIKDKTCILTSRWRIKNKKPCDWYKKDDAWSIQNALLDFLKARKITTIKFLDKYSNKMYVSNVSTWTEKGYFLHFMTAIKTELRIFLKDSFFSKTDKIERAS